MSMIYTSHENWELLKIYMYNLPLLKYTTPCICGIVNSCYVKYGWLYSHVHSISVRFVRFVGDATSWLCSIATQTMWWQQWKYKNCLLLFLSEDNALVSNTKVKSQSILQRTWMIKNKTINNSLLHDLLCLLCSLVNKATFINED